MRVFSATSLRGRATEKAKKKPRQNTVKKAVRPDGCVVISTVAAIPAQMRQETVSDHTCFVCTSKIRIEYLVVQKSGTLY
jgi:hypothetical protein